MGTTISTAQWLAAGVNVVLPIVVALVTSRAADGSIKAITLLLLSAVSSYLIAWLDAQGAGGAFDFSQASFTAVLGFVVAVASHFGLWKPSGITGSSGLVQGSVPVGIGGRHTL
jgi:hypothetical protein